MEYYYWSEMNCWVVYLGDELVGRFNSKQECEEYIAERA